MGNLTNLNQFGIGFDRIHRMLDDVISGGTSLAPTYPPYNIEKIKDDHYRLTMAVAGFKPDEIDITVEGNTLIISAKHTEKHNPDTNFLYKGIAQRSFMRKFELDGYIKIKNDAVIEHGILTLDLEREVPEKEKPQKISVKSI